MADAGGARERRRNPRGEGSRLRDEILEATLAEIADGGSVTLRGIARRAGIAAPSIYRHFDDLDAIMLAVAEDAFDELVGVLVAARDRHARSTDRLHAICDAYLEHARARPHLYQLMFGGVWNAQAALDAHPGDSDRLRTIGLDVYAVLVDAVAACAAEGASDSVDHELDATALWVALHGYADLRDTARLFPWPAHVDRMVVTALARLRED